MEVFGGGVTESGDAGPIGTLENGVGGKTEQVGKTGQVGIMRHVGIMVPEEIWRSQKTVRNKLITSSFHL
jgi:hypothetical protein